ncbi:DUF5677 domain-containing protein [Bacillus pseudomycoides]|uniref:DUF5677 domain-containing protein n=1 Tax=Bacillus pseudomycoides TaxID=64104 RepID=UPI003D1FEC0E
MEKELELEALSKSIRFAENLLINLGAKEDLNLEQKIILSIYRKLIEHADGNFILTDHMLAGPARIVARTSFENLLALKYILLEEEHIKNRAFCYYIGYIKSIQRKFENSSRETIPNHYRNAILPATSKILNDSLLNEILIEWKHTKGKSNYDPYWYSLFEGPKNIYRLVTKINDPKFYKYYSLLSEETHATQALNGLDDFDLINGNFSLLPIRSAHNIGFHERTVRAFCTSAIHEIIKYMSPDLNDDFINFMDEIGVIEKNRTDLIAKIQFK